MFNIFKVTKNLVQNISIARSLRSGILRGTMAFLPKKSKTAAIQGAISAMSTDVLEQTAAYYTRSPAIGGFIGVVLRGEAISGVRNSDPIKVASEVAKAAVTVGLPLVVPGGIIPVCAAQFASAGAIDYAAAETQRMWSIYRNADDWKRELKEQSNNNSQACGDVIIEEDEIDFVDVKMPQVVTTA